MSAVSVRGAVKRYGDVHALAGLDLEVPQGRIFGFLGPNGAGKTTTIHAMLGLVSLDAGSVQVFGHDAVTAGLRVRALCGVLLEHDGLYERLTVEENLRFSGAQFGMSKERLADRVEVVLGDASLLERRTALVGSLSRGLKRRLAAARAFLHDPELVILDEPTSGLDVEAAGRLRDALRRLSRGGTTVFLTTHHLEEIETLCHEVAIIKDGARVVQGAPSDLVGKGRRVEVRGPVMNSRARDVALSHASVKTASLRDGALVVELRAGRTMAPVLAALIKGGVKVEEVQRLGGLTAAFMEAVA